MTDELNISPDSRKIIYDAVNIVCDRLGLKFIENLKDSVGVRAAVLEDRLGLRYYMVAKRSIWMSKKWGAMVSINREIVRYCKEKRHKLIMFIEQGQHIYLFEPVRILQAIAASIGLPEWEKTAYENFFNNQHMYNFPVSLAVNAEGGKKPKLTKAEAEKSLESYLGAKA